MMKKLTVEAYLERNLKMKFPEGTCCYEPRCRDCAYMEMDNDHYYTFDGCSKLKDVYYQASESMWSRITISGSGNGFLTAANLHPNSSPLVIV